MKYLILLLIIPFFTAKNTIKEKRGIKLEEFNLTPTPDTSKVFMQGIEFEKSDGSQFQLEEFKGKVILLDFWATWCSPCVKQHKYVEKLSENINHSNFEIVTISIDSNKEKWKKYVKKHKWTGTHLYVGGNYDHPLLKMIAEEYKNEKGVSSSRVLIPQYYLIGKNLEVKKIRNIKSRKVKSMIKKMLR